MKLSIDELKGLFNGVGQLDHRKENLIGVKCPWCGDDEFGISLSDNHRFGCYRKKACGVVGNIFTLLRYLGKQIIDVRPSFEPRQRLENKLAIEEKEAIDLTLVDVSMPTGWKRTLDHPYLNERGFITEDYNRFEVGTTRIDSRFKDMVIFKVPQNGTNKGYIARSIKSKKEIDTINKRFKEQGSDEKILRYKNSGATDFSKLLLGIEEFTEDTATAILVEGLFDKVNTDRVLRLTEEDEVKCCCTFKCGASPEQIYLLQQSGIDTVVLLYDPDVIDEIKKAAWNLDQYFNVHIGYEESGKDPGDMSEEDFDKVFDNLRTPSQFDASKINVLELKKK